MNKHGICLGGDSIVHCTIAWYNGTHQSLQMIESFRDKFLLEFYVDGKIGKKIPNSIERILFRKLQMIDDAIDDRDLRVPPSNHFEKLQGSLGEFHSIRINDRYRLIFRWNGREGKASDLYLDDHSYK